MTSTQSVRSGVAVVGDSLTVPIASALTKDLKKDGWKDVRVDAEVGRAMSSSALVPSGITAIKGLKRKGFDPPAWIVALGTNDVSVTGDQRELRAWIEQLLATIGPHQVIWVNLWRTDTPAFEQRAQRFNALLAQVASDHDNVRVLDWAKTVEGHPEFFGPDKIHLSLRGDDQRTKAIVDAAVDQWS